MKNPEVAISLIGLATQRSIVGVRAAGAAARRGELGSFRSIVHRRSTMGDRVHRWRRVRWSSSGTMRCHHPDRPPDQPRHGDDAAVVVGYRRRCHAAESGALVIPRLHRSPLDAVAQSVFGKRTPGAAIGFRISRALNERFAAELSVDYLRTSLP